MQMGFNNDVDYLGMTLHIQTEDHGMAARKITSQLFFSGAILESKTLAYAASIEAIEVLEEQQELIRKQMRTMHKAFYKRIQEGAYDSKLVVHATREAEATGQFAAVSGGQPDEAAAAEFETLDAVRRTSRSPSLGVRALQSDDLEPASSGNQPAFDPPDLFDGLTTDGGAEVGEALASLLTEQPVPVGGVGVGRQPPVRLGTVRAYRGFTDPEDEISLTVALLKGLGGGTAQHRAQP